MVLADVVLVFLCLVDDDKLLLHQFGELNFFPLLFDGQLGFFELRNCKDILIVVVFLSGLETSRCPNQSSLGCKSRVPSCDISSRS
jgi:hypothetical protein